MNVATSSLFSQLLSLIDRNRFAKLVRETGSERRSKGFASWDHFVAMLFCQLAQARSLREIDGGLSSCEGKLKHLGMAGAPGRSTLTVWIEEKGEEMELLTNRFDLSAETIAEIYKQRWQIELFFKAIKQNLRIKTFVGTSANAVRIQIWTALIAMLLLKLLQFRSRIDWSLSNLVALLRWNLFTHKDLWKWIDDPFIPPPEPPPGTLVQAELDGIARATAC